MNAAAGDQGPTDEEIEDRLRRAPAGEWEALWAAAAEMEAEAEHETWSGGQQTGTYVVDDEERPVFQVPDVVYSDATSRVTRGLSTVGAVVPFPWPDWDGVARYRGGGQELAAAPVADAVRMATAIVRSERFTEGSIGGAIDDGTLAAVLARLRRWHDAELGRA